MPRFLSVDELYECAGGPQRVLRHLPPDVATRDRGALVASAIDFAESTAVSYLQSRYGTDGLPENPDATPPVLKATVADLAIYRLASRSNDVVSDDLQRKRDEAMTFLTDVSRGRADLGLSPAIPVDVSVPNVLTARSPTDQSLRRDSGVVACWKP